MCDQESRLGQYRALVEVTVEARSFRAAHRCLHNALSTTDSRIEFEVPHGWHGSSGEPARDEAVMAANDDP